MLVGVDRFGQIGGGPARRDLVQQILLALNSERSSEATPPQLLCASCTARLPITGVGLALMTARGPEELVAATDDKATVIEELQFSLGEGPCVDASSLGRPVLRPRLRDTAPSHWPSHWPGLGPAALDRGIEAIFAFPLHVGAIPLGVLDLYRDNPGTLNRADLAEALSFADVATRILLHLQDQMPPDGGLHPDLILADHDHTEVHQATGMIAVQAAVGLAEALLLLRASAYSTERAILAVAYHVVRGTLRFPPENDHHE